MLTFALSSSSVVDLSVMMMQSDNQIPSYDDLQSQMANLFPDWQTDVCREQAYFRLSKTLSDEHIQVEVNACNPESVDRYVAQRTLFFINPYI